MAFWKDNEGNELSFNEFISRWKRGIEGLTPLQKLKTQLHGTILILIGINIGIVISLFAFQVMWWLTIILVGALFNTFIQYVNQKEQIKLLETIEKQLEGGET